MQHIDLENDISLLKNRKDNNREKKLESFWYKYISKKVKRQDIVFNRLYKL